MKSVEEFFTTVREACDRSVWSRGVELVRANAVDGDSCEGGEATLRVSTRGGMICPLVTLYLKDLDWDCDCPSSSDPCEHVAASTIALRRARKEGHELPRASSGAIGAGRLQYTLKRARNGGLSLERAILRDKERFVLKSTLAAISSGRVDGPKFLATPEDLAIERALGPHLAGALPPGVLKALLPLLQPCPDVLLEDQPITISNDPVGPHGVVEDQAEGFRLFIQDDPSIQEHFGANIVRCGDVLAFLNKGRLSGRELSELPRGRYFSADQAPELVTEILPDLSQRIPVETRTTRLPKTGSEPPRIQVQVERDAGNLSVLPLLVYGDPPVARIDAGRLVPLGKGAIPLRNTGAEERLRNQLRNSLGLVPGRRTILPPEEAIDFSQRLEKFRMGDVSGDAHEDFFLAPALIPEVLWEDGDLVVHFSSAGSSPGSSPGQTKGASSDSSDSAFDIQARAVLDAWRSGESLVRLTTGGFAPLPTDWLERYGPSISDLLATKKAAGGKLPPCALADAASLCEEFDLPQPQGAEKLVALAKNFDGIPEASLPDDLQAELRHYQQDGINWLCFLRDAGLGALLADDMGLGKTLQALCSLQGHSLVIAPTSVLHNWADEIQRFRPTQQVCLYHGPGRKLDPEAQITLTTYSILRLDIDSLKKRDWDVVVLDEAQAIKNPDSQAARAARQLNANFRLALTGTPVENRLEELWSQLHFVNPGLLGGRRDFDQRYAKPIMEGDQETVERLRQRIRPFLLRRLKRDVAPELPPRSSMVLYCDLREDERRLYDALQAATRKDVIAQLQQGGNVLEALEALLRLRQACCHGGLVPGQTTQEPSSKTQLLLERLDQVVADGHKALVFSQWTSFLNLVEGPLQKAGIPYNRLDGSTRDRGSVVANFQDPDGPPVLLISLKAGGTGLNLTAADHIFLLDPWWNPAVEDQAADRAHRIGQDKPVMVYRLVAEKTVEERILVLQEKKRAISEAALGAGGTDAGSLGREDLLALLE